MKCPSKSPLGIRKTAVKYKFGLEWEELEAMHTAVDERCEICEKPLGLIASEERETLYVDHDHLSGKVRGILCRVCNVGLGHLQDSQHLLRRAISYLDKHADSGRD